MYLDELTEIEVCAQLKMVSEMHCSPITLFRINRYFDCSPKLYYYYYYIILVTKKQTPTKKVLY